jgi:hypothetical protein
LRRIENVPREFWGDDVQALRDRLDEILEEERQAEVSRDERKHREVVAAARRSRTASFLSVGAAVVSAIAAAISTYYAIPRAPVPAPALPSATISFASPTTSRPEIASPSATPLVTPR